MSRVTINTEAYNKETHKKPWAATQRLTPFDRSEMDFFSSKFAGEEGAAGSVSINAGPGDVVSTGIKPLAEGARSERRKDYIVQDDGALKECSSDDVRKHLLQRRADGQITPYETYRACTVIAALQSKYPGATADQCTTEAIAAQKAALSKKPAAAEAGAEEEEEAEQSGGPFMGSARE